MDYNHFFRFFSKNLYNPNKNYPVKISKLPADKLKFMDLSHVIVHSNPSVDLRSKMPPIVDQGNIGSCTANALCGIVEYLHPHLTGSRLFLYYNERAIEGNVLSDNGAYIHDGIKSLETNGICPESMWPYDVTKYISQPPKICYKAALNHKVLKANNIHNDITSMKSALIAGHPFVVGILVYSSFESDVVKQTGMVPMPIGTDTLLGGHAVVCVGYDDTNNLFIMRNSWGTQWGDHGYFYLPYAYLASSTLTSDLWCLTKIL
jgi:C1A family cysteine protease